MDTIDVRLVVVALLLDEEANEASMLVNFVNEDTQQLFINRDEEGCFRILITRHLLDNETKFREYFRLSTPLFYEVLSCIQEEISTPATNKIKKTISLFQKLCLTLRYLATGESFHSLAFQFRICHSWISKIIKETLRAITGKMLHQTIPTPDDKMLKEVPCGFYNAWNYPNCVGAIDGKHIRIVCPEKSGSLYFNYKDYFSTVLFAVIDHSYKFVMVEVGNYGKEGDAAIYLNSDFGKAVQSGSFPFPSPSPLPGSRVDIPYVFLGDEAFKLTPNFMRPYPKEQSQVDECKAVYNYRHSRARRVSENAFGILCQYFRVFFTPIAVKPETVIDLVTSDCILYNLMRIHKVPHPREGEEDYLPMPTGNLIALSSRRGNATKLAYKIRDTFKNYFCSATGAVDWQLDHVRKLK